MVHCDNCSSCHLCVQEGQLYKHTDTRTILRPKNLSMSISCGSCSLVRSKSHCAIRNSMNPRTSVVLGVSAKKNLVRSSSFSKGKLKSNWNLGRCSLDCPCCDSRKKWQLQQYYFGEEALNLLRAYEITISSVYAFKRCTNTKDWDLQVAKPTVKYGKSGKIVANIHCFPNLRKINSNTGWENKSNTTEAKLVKAFSHFSYQCSDKQVVVCNFFAAFDIEKKIITIVLPSLLTRDGVLNGSADLGLKGIRNFFHWHVCNTFCEGLILPKHLSQRFTPTDATCRRK